MHHSRWAGFIIDCQTGEPAAAANFWSAALGMSARATEDDRYVVLDGSARDVHIEVQAVSHESRVHLDIETDDMEAEISRLEKLGAKRLPQTHRGTWFVMEAPTGQRFCVVRAKHDLSTAPGVHRWP